MESDERETLGRIKQQLEDSKGIFTEIKDTIKEIFHDIEVVSKHAQKVESTLDTHIAVSKREFNSHKEDINFRLKERDELKTAISDESGLRKTFETEVKSSVLAIKVFVGFVGIIAGIPVAIIAIIQIIKMIGK